MYKVIIFALVSIALLGCSREAIMRVMTNSPNIESYSEKDFPKYNDYQLDLEYLRNFIKAAYPRLEQKISLLELDSMIQAQIDMAQDIDEKEFDLMLNKITVPLKDIHSCYQVDYRQYDDSLFFLVLRFEKGHWFVNKIDDSKSQSIVGKNVVEINGISVDSLDILIKNNVCGETDDYKRLMYRKWQIFPTFLKQVGILNDKNEITFKYQQDGVIMAETIIPKPKAGYHNLPTKKYSPHFLYKQNNGYFYEVDSSQNFAYLQMNTSLDYISIESEIKNYTSFLIRPFATWYLKRQKKDAMDFGKIVAQFFQEVDVKKVDNIILDISYNSGGDERPGKQFLWYLESAHNRSIKGFTDYVHYSPYFKKMVKKEARKVEEIYQSKFGTLPTLGMEINMTELMADSSYFSDITQPDSKFYLDPTVPKFSGELYVITSPETNSAAQILATTIVDNQLGKVVGVPPGNLPSNQTGALMFKLPKTKKILMLSYYYMERPNKSIPNNEELQLHQTIHQKIEDNLEGKKTVFEYIMSRIE
jgi:hypothetical protein